MPHTATMRHYPIFLDLTGRPVYVMGVGPAADRKAESVAVCGAAVRRSDSFVPSLLDACVLAIGTDAPDEDLRALSAAAQARGIPVNIVDRTELCSYITPSVIDRDPIGIAVSSGGAAPVLARLLRARIEAIIPPAYGRLAALAQRFQADIRRRLPDLAARRRMLEQAFSGDIADLVFAGDEKAAVQRFAQALDDADETRRGRVFLVGAGPGAADLLTLRAQRVLGEADVIVHDRLVTDDVLAMARRDAERIYVGKARAAHCVPQAEINALLVHLARDGRRVVRLKGGDPFIFGRGGEEAAALQAAGVAFEVVPGVTAALACAAQAAIPLTQREIARSVTLVTGHTSNGRLDVDFGGLVRVGGTLAIYMGAAMLPELCAGLIGHGLDPGIPAALIERGGQARQRELFATVGLMAARARGWLTGGPALVLVGEVVRRA